ncbi:MAG: acyl-CoA dehydratase activase [Phycisphaerales bacterium]|nr:acyl-CoA dehydratase activase [Phycisphaerales bacterium]
MICAGIDGGSRALKVVLFDHAAGRGGGGRGVLASAVRDQVVDHNALAEKTYQELLAQANVARSDVKRVIATGYARNLIKAADATITEITCHAAGVRHLCPAAMTVIEIGGQDSKLLRLDTGVGNGGGVRDFAMNDRCAAGTGRFLEMVASRLDTTLNQLGKLAERSTSPAIISSTCVVFAETEIIGLLASGVAREDIVAGVQHAIATRVAAMAGGRLDEPIVFTGGVAMIPGMREALAKALGKTVAMSPQPQITGALGAAILAGR